MKILKYLILTTIAAILFILCSWAAYIERGYSAVGGEIFVPIIPFILCYAAESLVKKIKSKQSKKRTCLIFNLDPNKLKQSG